MIDILLITVYLLFRYYFKGIKEYIYHFTIIILLFSILFQMLGVKEVALNMGSYAFAGFTFIVFENVYEFFRKPKIAVVQKANNNKQSHHNKKNSR